MGNPLLDPTWWNELVTLIIGIVGGGLAVYQKVRALRKDRELLAGEVIVNQAALDAITEAIETQPGDLASPIKRAVEKILFDDRHPHGNEPAIRVHESKNRAEKKAKAASNV